MLKKTVIILGYTCNNNCVFCCSSEKRGMMSSDEEILHRLMSARKGGSDYLELIGGEPTIHPHILGIVGAAKKLGFKTIMFATNGRMLSDRSFAKKILEAGVNKLVFSIHGHDSKVHDGLTQSVGSFDQLMEGIRVVQSLGLKSIGSNTTIVKQNYKMLPEIGKLIQSVGIDDAEFIFVDPTHGAPKTHFDELVPKYEDVSPYLNAVLNLGNVSRHWHVRYFPLCFIEERFHDRISENHEKDIFKTVQLAPDFENHDPAMGRMMISRIKVDRCKGCKLDCEGYWKEYVNHYGA